MCIMDNGNDLPAHVPFLENSDKEQFQQIVTLLYVATCNFSALIHST